MADNLGWLEDDEDDDALDDGGGGRGWNVERVLERAGREDVRAVRWGGEALELSLEDVAAGSSGSGDEGGGESGAT